MHAIEQRADAAGHGGLSPLGPDQFRTQAVDAVMRSPGLPLDDDVRPRMEAAFGTDFGDVRLHSDTAAAWSAEGLGAHAYTVGEHVVLGRGAGYDTLVHELAHVVQQRRGAAAPGPLALSRAGDSSERAADAAARQVASGGRGAAGLVGTSGRQVARQPDPSAQREEDDESSGLWPTLTPSAAKTAQALRDDCDDDIGVLDEAQMVHVSELREAWLVFLRKLRSRIETVESDGKLAALRNVYQDYDGKLGGLLAGFQAEWAALNRRYTDEHAWLLSARVRSTDSIEAGRYLDSVYRTIKIPFLVTDDDYAPLKDALDSQEYVRVGALRGARMRAQQLRPMMDTVADLRRRGEDANKFVPEWSDRVLEEAAYLDSFARIAREQKREYAGELAELRQRLLDQRDETLKVKPDTDSTLEKGAALIRGGVGAVLGVFVEAAKEAVDLVQINLHFVSFGHYEPRFISDMAAAAQRGATTGDLLKGMITGLINTPSRFLHACRDGDWEAIGRESVNLYVLAETVRSAPQAIEKVPELVGKLPELIAKTRESLRVLRERTVALGLKDEARLSPEPASHQPVQTPAQSPAAPSPPAQTTQAPGPATETPPSAKPAPAPAPVAVPGRGKGVGPSAGMLRDTDATSRSITVDASHPAVRNKSVVNTNQPPPPARAAAAKAGVNAPREVPAGRVVDSTHRRPPDEAVNQPSMSARPPSAKHPASTGSRPEPSRRTQPAEKAQAPDKQLADRPSRKAVPHRVNWLNMGNRRKSGAQWWLRDVDRAQVKASQTGYQVYEYYDRGGQPLYVGKSGGEGGVTPGSWVDRGWDHLKNRPAIAEANRIVVHSDLTQQEAFALEQDRIAELHPALNKIEGEFTRRSQQGAADLAANVQSASSRPTYTFRSDMVPRIR